MKQKKNEGADTKQWVTGQKVEGLYKKEKFL